MTDHLNEAKSRAKRADGSEPPHAQTNATLAVAYALVERLDALTDTDKDQLPALRTITWVDDR